MTENCEAPLSKLYLIDFWRKARKIRQKATKRVDERLLGFKYTQPKHSPFLISMVFPNFVNFSLSQQVIKTCP